MPARYNFNQGYIYRLKITSIPGRPSAALYPSIEVAPTTPATDAYLAHNAIPVQFTTEDFEQVIDGGNFVTKVIYLPDPKFQELAVSRRRDPSLDPARAGHRSHPRSRQARHDPADRAAGCHRPRDARNARRSRRGPRGKHRAGTEHVAARCRTGDRAGGDRDP